MARYSGSTQGPGFGGPNLIAYGVAKQRNRQLRNDVDARSALTGVTWQQGEQLWRDKYGYTGMQLSLDSNMHLQQIYDLMGSANNSKPAAAAAAPKPIVPQISQASKKYRADTEKLLKEIAGEREKFATDQKVAEQARIEREKIARETAITSASNLARAGKSPELQIRPTESAGADAAGTNRFKRRRQQFKIGKPSYSGLSISKGKMVNI